MKKVDIFEQWSLDGQLGKMLEFIKDCSRKLVTQKEMCESLKIHPSLFSRLKKEHPEIQEAQNKGRFELKKDLASALYKKAVGFEVIEEDKYVEEDTEGSKQKTKIRKVKKQIPPDYKSIVYLLTKVYGKEYSERFEDLELMERKLEISREEWMPHED